MAYKLEGTILEVCTCDILARAGLARTRIIPRVIP